MVLTDKVYNILKWIVMIFLPATGTLYFGLATIWGLPYIEEVLGTITAISTFLGALIGLSATQYNKKPTVKK